MSKLFYGDFNSLISTLTRLILAFPAGARAPAGRGLAPPLNML